jgi:outer membrane protein OmpA-like peptidoglycan-associated protein
MKAAVAALIALSILGCAQPPAPKPRYSERVILLPNRDGRQSAVIVKRATGEQELSTPYQALELAQGKEQPGQLNKTDVEQRYGGVLNAQPARPFSYTLYFNSATTDLTPQSRASLNEVRQKIKGFPAAQVTVIGHTDRVGTPESNDALSLKRAGAVREMLIQIGIARDAIEVVGRGEREPLVATPDGRPEERNRRVEIKLR